VKCDAQFKKHVLDCCYQSLQNVGFRRRRKHDADWPLSPAFTAWVGLNTGLYSDRLEINPYVGVHAPEVEKLRMKLSGLQYPGRSGPSATYAKNIGELDAAKQERVFSFQAHLTEEDIGAEAKRLARLLQTTGLAYSKSIASYETLLPLMRERVGMLGGYPQRVCCCLHLMGLRSEARAFAEHLSREEPEALGSFAAAFIEFLDSKA
jgi:hypothetical protein